MLGTSSNQSFEHDSELTSLDVKIDDVVTST